MNSYDWSEDLPDSIWFQIGRFLSIEDIKRLSRTSPRLNDLLTSHDFWSFLIRSRFGSNIWRRFIKNSSILPLEEKSSVCRAKSLFVELNRRKLISVADENLVRLDNNRNHLMKFDQSSLNGQILHIDDSIEFCYSIQIETQFKNILPGRYDVIWRMKLDLPYMLGETDFIAAPEKAENGKQTVTRWTQDDFLMMYRCFHCDISKTNLWFYQSMGTVEIIGSERSDVYVSMINHDEIHSKHGLFIDSIELKLRND